MKRDYRYIVFFGGAPLLRVRKEMGMLKASESLRAKSWMEGSGPTPLAAMALPLLWEYFPEKALADPKDNGD